MQSKIPCTSFHWKSETVRLPLFDIPHLSSPFTLCLLSVLWLFTRDTLPLDNIWIIIRFWETDHLPLP